MWQNRGTCGILLHHCKRRGKRWVSATLSIRAIYKHLHVATHVHSMMGMMYHGISSSPIDASEFFHLFASRGSILEANIMFCMIPKQPHPRDWCALMSAHSSAGQNVRALELFYIMLWHGVEPDKYAYTCVLNICSKLQSLEHGKSIHHHIVSSTGTYIDDFMRSSLIDMYGKCGCLESASQVFEGSSNERSVVVWTSMISAYVQQEQSICALTIFGRMHDARVSPNYVTILCLLKACSHAKAIEEGMLLHALVIVEVIKSKHSPLLNTLIHMYCNCGHLEEAQQTFNSLVEKSVVSWGVMIGGYVEVGDGYSALHLQEEMENKGMKANDKIYVCSLKACGMLGDISKGMHLQNEIVKIGCEKSVIVGSTLVDMYARCGHLAEACKVFEDLPERNVVTWAAIIGGLAEQGHGHLSLQLFESMQHDATSLEPDRVIYLCVLKACSSLCLLQQGRVIHDQILKSGLDYNEVTLNNSIIDMYAKCRQITDACKVFHGLHEKNIVSWSTIISGFVEIGDNHQSLKMFEEMESKEGASTSNKSTLSCILKVCSCIGALMQGREIHTKIIKFGFESDRAVINGLIDMYAKCGSLDEAQQVLSVYDSSLVDLASWGALIHGYCQHGKMSLATQCLEKMQKQGLKLNNIILTSLLNACSHSGQLQEGIKISKNMANVGIPSIENVTTMVDLLGVNGCVDEAKHYLRSVPQLHSSNASCFPLLTACRMHGDIETGHQSYAQINS